MTDPEARKPLNPMVQTIKKNCPDWIGIGVRNESESVSGMDRNHCPKIIGMGVRIGSESLSGMDWNQCPEWVGIRSKARGYPEHAFSIKATV